MTEADAHGISFEIDHYIPQKARPDLVCDYSNLMYACKVCNRFKWDLYPPAAAQSDNYRFFKADVDFFGDHYVFGGLRLTGRSNIGEFTIDALHLNRSALRKLRESRQKLAKCDEHVSRGMFGLRKFSIDQLPRPIRLKAKRLIEEWLERGDTIPDKVERVIRELNRSELLDPETEDTGQAVERARRLKLLESRYPPGPWRAGRGTSGR
jgi:hypothetical protein